jgi:hypothetical protein
MKKQLKILFNPVRSIYSNNLIMKELFMENTNKKTAICRVGTGYTGGSVSVARSMGTKGGTVASYRRNFIRK